jgi:hypothetical protein
MAPRPTTRKSALSLIEASGAHFSGSGGDWLAAGLSSKKFGTNEVKMYISISLSNFMEA